MTKLILLGMTLTNQNCVYEKNKSRLNLGNARYIQLSIIQFDKAHLWFRLTFFSFFLSYTAPTTLLIITEPMDTKPHLENSFSTDI
jgi:hypothetical protein